MARFKNIDPQTQLFQALSEAATSQAQDRFAVVFEVKLLGLISQISSEPNYISGTNAAEVLSGMNGNDHISAYAGHDILLGTEGADILNGGIGNDTMFGGNGNDTYYVDSVFDVVLDSQVDTGYDMVYTSADFVILEGSMLEKASTTDIDGTKAINLTGANRDEVLVGNAGSNNLYGNGGYDFLFGNAGSDRLEGGAGKDRLDGGAGADTMVGGTEDDVYVVDNIGDVVVENASEGTDLVIASLSCTLGQISNLENISALEGSIVSFLGGNGGDNRIVGNSGVNRLSGGGGRDEFSLDAGVGTVDRIVDFSSSDDTMRLTHTKLSPGKILSSEQFCFGKTAHDADDRVIYNYSDGSVYFDQDGIGAIAQKLVAVLENTPTNVTASDFFIA